MMWKDMVLLLPCFVACGGVPAGPSAKVERVALLGARTFPEGIAAHAKTGDLFVGGVAEGEIQRVRGHRVEEFKHGERDGLLNVIGLAVDAARDRLWVCSTSFADPTVPPSLVVFDARSGERLATLAVPADGAPHFLNDVDVDGAGNAYATDSLAPVIWRVPSDLSRIEAFVRDPVFAVDPAGFNLNGITVVEDRYLLASVPSMRETGRGKLFRIDMADRSITAVTLSASYLGADGLVLVGPRRVISIGAPPGLHRLDFDGSYTSARVTPIEGFASALDRPTTGAIVGERMWVVNSQLDHYVTAVFGDRGPPHLPFEIVGLPLESL